jgi:hypothetical protein
MDSEHGRAGIGHPQVRTLAEVARRADPACGSSPAWELYDSLTDAVQGIHADDPLIQGGLR